MNMKALIIEDELPAARRLKKLLEEVSPETEVLDVIDSVEDAVAWLKNMASPDLIFMDIELADGRSFEIFDQVSVNCPVIFATAYDQFAINAFKVNGFDYLLKPLEKTELADTMDRLKRQGDRRTTVSYQDLSKLLEGNSNSTQYKERFLIKVGEHLKYVPVEQVAYFYSENSAPYLCTKEGRNYIVDYSLDQLKELLDPNEFFRVSRKVIVHHSAIAEITTWFNGRLKLKLRPETQLETLVSRDRVSEFKIWLDN